MDYPVESYVGTDGKNHGMAEFITGYPEERTRELARLLTHEVSSLGVEGLPAWIEGGKTPTEDWENLSGYERITSLGALPTYLPFKDRTRRITIYVEDWYFSRFPKRWRELQTLVASWRSPAPEGALPDAEFLARVEEIQSDRLSFGEPMELQQNTAAADWLHKLFDLDEAPVASPALKVMLDVLLQNLHPKRHVEASWRVLPKEDRKYGGGWGHDIWVEIDVQMPAYQRVAALEKSKVVAVEESARDVAPFKMYFGLRGGEWFFEIDLRDLAPFKALSLREQGALTRRVHKALGAKAPRGLCRGFSTESYRRHDPEICVKGSRSGALHYAPGIGYRPVEAYAILRDIFWR
jgi:hypothetical protein